MNNGGFGNSRVFVYAAPTAESDSNYIKNYGYMGALQPNDSTRAALYLRYFENPGAWYNYGTTGAAYSMPLKKDVEYVFSFDFGQWGEGDGDNNIQIYDAADSVVFNRSNLHAEHINEGGKATHVSGTFKPSADGNCRISLWSPGDKKHYNVFSNFKLVKATSRDIVLGAYTVDSLVGKQYVDTAWVDIELKNYAASLTATEKGDTVALKGVLSADNVLYGVLNIADMEITFYPQPVDGDSSLIFCKEVPEMEEIAPVVAKFDQEGNLAFDGWTIINTDINHTGIICKDIVCSLSKGEPQYIEQTITWDQTFENLAIGTPVTLEATASSGLEVVFTMAETTIATLEDGVLTFTEAGEVTVTATQPGDFYYKAAQPVEKKIKVDPAGIESIAAEEAAPVYYNLQGIRVNNPQPGHTYVVVRGGNVTKTLVK